MTAPLARAMSGLVPGEEETAFLRACLIGGDRARRSWSEWLCRRGPLEDVLTRHHRYRRLGPLLAAAGLPVADAKIRAALQAAVLREGRRHDALRVAAADVVRRLMDADAEPVVLNGFAHAELAYPAPDLRHTHDLDLLVAEAGRVPAVLGRAPPTAFRHDNGTRVRLWRTPFPRPAPPSPAATVRLPLGAVPARALGAEAALVAAAIHAFRHGRSSLVWAADAYFTIARRPVDWDLVARFDSAVAIPLVLTLSWLREFLGAPVPPRTLERLEERAATTAAARAAAPAIWRAARRCLAARRAA